MQRNKKLPLPPPPPPLPCEPHEPRRRQRRRLLLTVVLMVIEEERKRGKKRRKLWWHESLLPSSLPLAHHEVSPPALKCGEERERESESNKKQIRSHAQSNSTLCTQYVQVDTESIFPSSSVQHVCFPE